MIRDLRFPSTSRSFLPKSAGLRGRPQGSPVAPRPARESSPQEFWFRQDRVRSRRARSPPFSDPPPAPSTRPFGNARCGWPAPRPCRAGKRARHGRFPAWPNREERGRGRDTREKKKERGQNPRGSGHWANRVESGVRADQSAPVTFFRAARPRKILSLPRFLRTSDLKWSSLASAISSSSPRKRTMWRLGSSMPSPL